MKMTHNHEGRQRRHGGCRVGVNRSCESVVGPTCAGTANCIAKVGNDMMERFKHRYLSIAATIGFGLFPANPASAAVRYTFTVFSGPEQNGEHINGGGFSLTVPSFVTGDPSFSAASLTNCSVSTNMQPTGGTCMGMEQDFYSNPVRDYLGFGTDTTLNPLTWSYYNFVSGAFSAPGTYASVPTPGYGTGQMLVELVADVDTPAVPEPAAWAMMLSGLAMVGGAMRRRSMIVRFA